MLICLNGSFLNIEKIDLTSWIVRICTAIAPRNDSNNNIVVFIEQGSSTVALTRIFSRVLGAHHIIGDFSGIISVAVGICDIPELDMLELKRSPRVSRLSDPMTYIRNKQDENVTQFLLIKNIIK